MEVELLEFLLRLMEVLFVPVDDPLSLVLSPFLREESVQTVWRESFALRYSLSDVLVSLPFFCKGALFRGKGGPPVLE